MELELALVEAAKAQGATIKSGAPPPGYLENLAQQLLGKTSGKGKRGKGKGKSRKDKRASA